MIFSKPILFLLVFSMISVFSVDAQQRADLKKDKSKCWRPIIISVGVVNNKAINLVQPLYPPAAQMARVSGEVPVRIQVNESGDVEKARATSGNILLKPAAIKAARQSKFKPMFLNINCPVKVNGTIIYKFIQ